MWISLLKVLTSRNWQPKIDFLLQYMLCVCVWVYLTFHALVCTVSNSPDVDEGCSINSLNRKTARKLTIKVQEVLQLQNNELIQYEKCDQTVKVLVKGPSSSKFTDYVILEK